ncbi:MULTISPECIES: hypothetical protein [unclassified Pseudomonas]|uniref:hypothetical protein n=1 Tax=unclassified Pseudomonas TaxID=196821 RepID=UPI00119CDDAA|nr:MULTISPECIES: hypothetical protein [unclassified Pseudomonas]TWC27708.1 hypothetical protein FBY05_101573 [Pseudomonas sp. SJZ083]TWC53952.1 hypothetical protein FBY01_101143 [Pseudomonas sp. SJZ077]
MTQMEAWAHFAGQALAGVIAGKDGSVSTSYAASRAAENADELLEHYKAKYEELTGSPPPFS